MKCDNCGNEMDCYKISKDADALERRFRCMACGVEKVVITPDEDDERVAEGKTKRYNK